MVKKQFPRIFSPEIKKLQNTQLFEFKGRDARGYDFTVQLRPRKKPLPWQEPPHAAASDQIEVFFGSDPAKLNDIGTEIEIQMGKEPEVYKLNSASIVYIPKGLEHADIIFNEASGYFWHLNITLPPKYAEPVKSKKKIKKTKAIRVGKAVSARVSS
jgi:hypothetical protein